MKKVPVYNIDGEVMGEEILEVKDESINKDVIYYYVNAYLTNQRKGTASARTRGEVSGGGRKPWRQKGTGRARTGSIRNPIWRGGGIIFGPKPKEYRVRLPKKMKRKALIETIKDKVIEDRVLLVDTGNFEEVKTKKIFNFLKKVGIDKERVLFLLNKENTNRENIVKSIRNISLVDYDYSDQMNAYDVLRADRILIEKDIFGKVKEILESENGS